MPRVAELLSNRQHTSTTVPGSSCRALYRGDDASGVAGSSSFRRTLRKRALQKGHRFSISAHRTMQGKQNLRAQQTVGSSERALLHNKLHEMLKRACSELRWRGTEGKLCSGG